MEGNRFKLARTKYNKNGRQSVKTVADATGISSSLINDIETNSGKKMDRDTGYSKIAILAKHYGVTSDYLMGLSEFPTVDVNEQAACSYTGLSVDAVRFLHSIYARAAEFDRQEMLSAGVVDALDWLNNFIQSGLFIDCAIEFNKLSHEVEIARERIDSFTAAAKTHKAIQRKIAEKRMDSEPPQVGISESSAQTVEDYIAENNAERILALYDQEQHINRALFDYTESCKKYVYKNLSDYFDVLYHLSEWRRDPSADVII